MNTLLILLAAAANAGIFYDLAPHSSSATMKLSGVMKVAASTGTPNAAKITLDGPNGDIQAGSMTISGVATAARFSGSGYSLTDISSDSIKAGAINTSKLATDSVTTVKILDANVNTNKLATDSVTTVKILDAAVNTNKLATDSVTTVKILDANVNTNKLATDSVTPAKILSDSAGLRKVSGDLLAATSGGQDNTNLGEATLVGGRSVSASADGDFGVALGRGLSLRTAYGAVFGLNSTCGAVGGTNPIFCGGGEALTCYGPHGSCPGGYDNQLGSGCTKCNIDGGESHRMNGTGTGNTIGGGRTSTVGNVNDSTVLGGLTHTIDNSADNSTVGGRYGRVSHPGAFVYNASSGTRISDANYAGTFDFPGGVYFHIGLTTVTWGMDGKVDAAMLQTGSVDTSKLANGSVTAAKVMTESIDTDKIKNGAITAAKIMTGAVDTAGIGPDAVGASELLSAAGSLVKVSGGAMSASGGDATMIGKLNLGATGLVSNSGTGSFIVLKATSATTTRLLEAQTSGGTRLVNMFSHEVRGSSATMVIADPFYGIGTDSAMRTDGKVLLVKGYTDGGIGAWGDQLAILSVQEMVQGGGTPTGRLFEIKGATSTSLTGRPDMLVVRNRGDIIIGNGTAPEHFYGKLAVNPASLTDAQTLPFSVNGATFTVNGSNTKIGNDLSFTGPAPAIACNAGSPTIESYSTNNAGRFTGGAASANCTVTFTRAFTNPPSCWCNDETNVLVLKATPTTTTLVCTAAVTIGTDVVSYGCSGME